MVEPPPNELADPARTASAGEPKRHRSEKDDEAGQFTVWANVGELLAP